MIRLLSVKLNYKRQKALFFPEVIMYTDWQRNAGRLLKNTIDSDPDFIDILKY